MDERLNLEANLNLHINPPFVKVLGSFVNRLNLRTLLYYNTSSVLVVQLKITLYNYVCTMGKFYYLILLASLPLLANCADLTNKYSKVNDHIIVSATRVSYQATHFKIGCIILPEKLCFNLPHYNRIQSLMLRT